MHRMEEVHSVANQNVMPLKPSNPIECATSLTVDEIDNLSEVF